MYFISMGTDRKGGVDIIRRFSLSVVKMTRISLRVTEHTHPPQNMPD
jgi:hypothetical protein